jgi:hypothetical protein
MKTKQLQLVTFEQAKRLRKLGFDWESRSLYFSDDKKIADDYILFDYNSTKIEPLEAFSAPIVALALKWFRDEKGLFGCVQFAIVNFRKGHYYKYFSFSNKKIAAKSDELFGKYEDAERALLDGLLSVLEKEYKHGKNY